MKCENRFMIILMEKKPLSQIHNLHQFNTQRKNRREQQRTKNPKSNTKLKTNAQKFIMKISKQS